jgi:uncharacterized protein YydD (DUF2326 family)
MNQLIFDFQEKLSIVPSTERVEPVVWIEHLVIIDSLNNNAEILREISFRRGLNIIRTEQRQKTEKNSIGHDVGKTLLTRFIRYLLGEQYYGNNAVRSALSYSMKDAYVVGRIFVNGVSWIVARPIGQIGTQRHFAFQSDDWKEVLTCQEYPKFSIYVEAISDAVLSNIPDVTHSGMNKRNQWLNILAWLTRDQKCALRTITDWRHPETESGTGQIQQKEANQLIRLVMNMLDTEEQKAIVDHKKLLRKKREFTRQFDNLQRDLNALHIQLFNKFRSKNDQDQYLFINKFKEDIKKKISGLKELRQDYNHGFPTHEEEQYMLQNKKVDKLQGQIEQSNLELERYKGLILQRQKSTDNSGYDVLEKICTNPDCPLKKDNSTVVDIEKEEKIREYKEEIERIIYNIEKLQNQLDEEKSQLTNIKLFFFRKRKEFRKKIDGISGAISRYSIQKEQCEKYEKFLDKQIELNNELQNNLQQINESNSKQQRIREEYGNKKRQYENFFDIVTRHLMNEKDHSKIIIDGNGLRVCVDENKTGSGEANNSGIVLSFDWMTCIASICGVGYHPRFLIHDSPREADREHEAYHQLFYFASKLDSMFTETAPSFQYIITTTTPPPDFTSGANYVRSVLHSRDIEGLLLKKYF